MLDRISVAAPCHADWESMSGTDRVRHCGQCDKNVYNISAISRQEAEDLIRENEGRLCVRFYRRADGTVLTQNCPVGLRAIGRRISRVAGAAMSAAAAVASASAAQFPMLPIAAEMMKATGTISGIVEDATGAELPGAHVHLLEQRTGKKLMVRSDKFGKFQVDDLNKGGYIVQIDMPGFLPETRQLALWNRDELKVVLQVGQVTTGGGISVPYVTAPFNQ